MSGMNLRDWIDSMKSRYTATPVEHVDAKDFGRWLDQYLRNQTRMHGEEKFYQFSQMHDIPVSELHGVARGEIAPSAKLLRLLNVGQATTFERQVIQAEVPCYYPLD